MMIARFSFVRDCTKLFAKIQCTEHLQFFTKFMSEILIHLRNICVYLLLLPHIFLPLYRKFVIHLVIILIYNKPVISQKILQIYFEIESIVRLLSLRHRLNTRLRYPLENSLLSVFFSIQRRHFHSAFNFSANSTSFDLFLLVFALLDQVTFTFFTSHH